VSKLADFRSYFLYGPPRNPVVQGAALPELQSYQDVLTQVGGEFNITFKGVGRNQLPITPFRLLLWRILSLFDNQELPENVRNPDHGYRLNLNPEDPHPLRDHLTQEDIAFCQCLIDWGASLKKDILKDLKLKRRALFTEPVEGENQPPLRERIGAFVLAAARAELSLLVQDFRMLESLDSVARSFNYQIPFDLDALAQERLAIQRNIFFLSNVYREDQQFTICRDLILRFLNDEGTQNLTLQEKVNGVWRVLREENQDRNKMVFPVSNRVRNMNLLPAMCYRYFALYEEDTAFHLAARSRLVNSTGAKMHLIREMLNVTAVDLQNSNGLGNNALHELAMAGRNGALVLLALQRRSFAQRIDQFTYLTDAGNLLRPNEFVLFLSDAAIQYYVTTEHRLAPEHVLEGDDFQDLSFLEQAAYVGNLQSRPPYYPAQMMQKPAAYFLSDSLEEQPDRNGRENLVRSIIERRDLGGKTVWGRLQMSRPERVRKKVRGIAKKNPRKKKARFSFALNCLSLLAAIAGEFDFCSELHPSDHDACGNLTTRFDITMSDVSSCKIPLGVALAGFELITFAISLMLSLQAYCEAKDDWYSKSAPYFHQERDAMRSKSVRKVSIFTAFSVATEISGLTLTGFLLGGYSFFGSENWDGFLRAVLLAFSSFFLFPLEPETTTLEDQVGVFEAASHVIL